MDVSFAGELWLWPGDAAWHFVSLPESVADDIAARLELPRSGFGALKVHVRVGATEWDTSIFPDSKAGTYVLPVKRQGRDREGIEAGDVVNVHLTVDCSVPRR